MFRRCVPGLLMVFLCARSVAADAVAVLPPPLWEGQPTIASFQSRQSAHLTAAQGAIARLLAVSGKRTVDNTVAPFDEAMWQIDCAAYLAALIQAAHPEKSFRDAATAESTRASAALSAILLDPAVYKAFSGIDVAAADSTTRYYVQRVLLEFRLAGVDKPDSVRKRLKQLNDQLTEQQSAFDRNISDDKHSVVAAPTELAGLPADLLARHKAATDGSITFSTDYPDSIPIATFARSAALRHRMRVAFATRGYPVNQSVLRSLLDTRQQIATLIGYPTWADYNAADKMIQKGSNIQTFIDQVDSSLRALTDREQHMLLDAKRQDDPKAQELLDEDLSYYQEQVRRQKYDFDSQSVRPYFPYAQVKQGILDTAAALFHVRFEPAAGTSAWHSSVETWLVYSAGAGAGSAPIGRLYLDMQPRAGKYSHAEMIPLIDGVRGRHLPEGVLLCNFPLPGKDDPALMNYDDVTAFFHEFGHLMHHILGGQQPWAGISGLNSLGLESDFVEAPSQMLEEWLHSPQVLAKFARHYQTHEPIPAALVARMNRATSFGRAGWGSRQNVFSAISYHVYNRDPRQVDFDAITATDTHRYLRVGLTPGTHIWASFGHLGNYSSAYYTYLWDKVIALDIFAQFDRGNLLGGSAPERYRKLVLEPGASMSANDLVKQFLGRPQNMQAFESWVAEEFAPEH